MGERLKSAIHYLLIVVGAALACLLAYPALGFMGVAGVYLAPGFAAAPFVPVAMYSWFDGDPEASHGTLTVFLVSFLVWWLLLTLATLSIYVSRKSLMWRA